MSSTVLDNVGQLRQRWIQMVEDVTPSHLPTTSVSQQQKDSPLSQLHIKIPSLQGCREQCNISPLELIKTAWACLLRYYTGSEDILFAGIELGSQRELKTWPNASICRAKLSLDDAILHTINKIQEAGMLESESSMPLPDAINTFASLVSKPFNSAICQRHPSHNLTREFSNDEALKLLDDPMVCLYTCH